MESNESSEPRVDLPPAHPDCLRCRLREAFAEMARTHDEPTFLAKRREILGY